MVSAAALLQEAIEAIGVDPNAVDPRRVLAGIAVDVNAPATARVAAARALMLSTPAPADGDKSVEPELPEREIPNDELSRRALAMLNGGRKLN